MTLKYIEKESIDIIHLNFSMRIFFQKTRLVSLKMQEAEKKEIKDENAQNEEDAKTIVFQHRIRKCRSW